MYHNDPTVALEELNEEALLPNPVLVRDMIIRSRLSPEQALELNRGFQKYHEAFGEAMASLRPLLEKLAAAERK
ncbi:MAG TPA: hypothetical protein DEH78_31285 [Solibacterales bacterium]|nr:hypothetical protein [Bryobacterales bacterium]